MPYRWIEAVLSAMQKSDISPREVMEVLTSSHRERLIKPGTSGSIAVLAVLGRTDNGRALLVAIRHEDNHSWVIAGARDLEGAALKELQDREEGNR